jgi:type I restriction enzyme M protein
LPVFINFQDFDGHHPPPGERTLPGIPTRNIFLGMGRELVTAAREAVSVLELPELGAVPPRTSLHFRKFLDTKLPNWFNNDQPFARFRGLLDIIRAAVKPKRLLLILDEFDRIQEGIASGITSDQVPENMRHVFQAYGDIGGVFTGSRTIRRLRQEYWNVLFGLGESHQLRGLDEESALGLVEQPVAGRLVYSPAASRHIIELCARQPLLVQSICGRLFETCKESGERTVTVEMVDKVAEEKAADNEHFETLWGYIRSNRQRCLVFVVDELAEQHGTLAFSVIADAAERHGIRFGGAGDLERDLDDLLDLEVLRAHGERRRQIYRIEVPLFSMWLKRTKDFEQYRRAAKEEL